MKPLQQFENDFNHVLASTVPGLKQDTALSAIMTDMEKQYAIHPLQPENVPSAVLELYRKIANARFDHDEE